MLTGALGETLSGNGISGILFREMRCEACKQPLREYFYYECDQGCVRSVKLLR
jgi:hypothetical protein